jgi:hypothetical protein
VGVGFADFFAGFFDGAEGVATDPAEDEGEGAASVDEGPTFGAEAGFALEELDGAGDGDGFAATSGEGDLTGGTEGAAAGVIGGLVPGGAGAAFALGRGAAGEGAAATRERAVAELCSAARFIAWARVHFNRCPTRPRCNCCFRQEEEQNWKTEPSRFT